MSAFFYLESNTRSQARGSEILSFRLLGSWLTFCVRFDKRWRKKFPTLRIVIKLFAYLTQDIRETLHLLRENLLLCCCCCCSAWKFDSCALTRSCQVDKAALPLLFLNSLRQVDEDCQNKQASCPEAAKNQLSQSAKTSEMSTFVEDKKVNP